MSDTLRIAILGLGEVGELFAEHLLEKIQIKGKPVKIVAVADPDTQSPVALGFSQSKIPVFEKYLDVVDMANDIDIIFDLTPDPMLKQRLRLELLSKKNRHTTIASQDVARLLWYFFDEDIELPRIKFMPANAA